jgi:hypothetical protein
MKRVLRSSLFGALVILVLPLAGWSADQPGKSPLWSMAASLILPGGGQFYCESYVKGALFGVAQGALTAMTLYEHLQTEESIREYRKSGDLQDYADYTHHFDRRSSLIWWDAGVFCLCVADAFADAHLYGFGGGSRAKIGMAKSQGVGLSLNLSF